MAYRTLVWKGDHIDLRTALGQVTDPAAVFPQALVGKLENHLSHEGCQPAVPPTA